MAEKNYYGTYARFDTDDKKEAMMLIGPDNPVGDRYRIVIKESEDGDVAWLYNKFDKPVGHLNQKITQDMNLCKARGWEPHAFLSFLAYSEKPDPGFYWGEVIIMAYSPALNAPMATFEKKLMSAMAEGTRPNIDFGEGSIQQIVETKGTWFPTDRVRLPKMDKHSAMVKDQQNANERLIEESRKGNKGCYAATFVFYAVIIVAVLYGLHSCGVF